MAVLGLDIGSTFVKAVLFDKEIIETLVLPTTFEPLKTINEITSLFEGQYDYTVSTGYGRELAASDKRVTEITCHAKGAAYLFNGEANTVIDIGGQDSKVICLNGKGGVSDFVMNDKCAAGTGRFIDYTLKAMNERFDNIDELTKGAYPCQINSMCTVFAESEVISQLSAGTDKADIILGIVHSVCKRIVNQQLMRLDYKKKIAFTGGLHQSRVVCDTLSKYAGAQVLTCGLSQFAGAVGAAVIGSEIRRAGELG